MSLPVPVNETARLDALHRLEILDTLPEPAFDRITQHVARIFGAPMALVSLVDDHRQWFKSRVGVEVSETTRAVAFCAHAIVDDGVMVVPDASLDPRFRANPLVTGPLGIRFYAAAPIRIGHGCNVGTLCFMDTAPRPALSNDEMTTLSDFADVVAGEFEMRQEVRKRREVESALAESEKRYRSVVDNIREVIFQTDAEGRWTFLNRAWSEVMGFSVEESLGRNFLEFVHPEDGPENAELFALLINRQKEYCRHEVRYLTKSGGSRWVEVYAGLTLIEGGGIAGTSGTLNDVTDRRTIEGELRAAKEAAERASRAKNEFLSRVSHELRTPMNTIIGFTQLLEMDGGTRLQRENTGRILRAARHLLGLLNEILDIARIESGHLSVELQALRPLDVVRTAVEMMQPLFESKQIQLIQHAIDGAGVAVVADRQRLLQVLLNLFSNAAKYNRPGGQVTLSCERLGSSFRINVADTGLGIPADRFASLFQPFERLGAERTAVEGTGLGLALSKHLMELMNGNIGLESALDQGSTFWIELPISEITTAQDETSECPQAVPVNCGFFTVLYIEDNPQNIILVERILGRRDGVRLITATNGKLGLEMALKQAPDLVLLDLHLPDMSGLSVLRLLGSNSLTSAIPVVVLSADALPSTRKQLLAAGARRFFTKPLDVKEFLTAIDLFLEQEVTN
jgi:PAS domain S-box-containing protein